LQLCGKPCQPSCAVDGHFGSGNLSHFTPRCAVRPSP
jgi:hypothetical protein